MELKPATEIGVIDASVLPVNAMSICPLLIILKASLMAWVPDAQAVVMVGNP